MQSQHSEVPTPSLCNSEAGHLYKSPTPPEKRPFLGLFPILPDSGPEKRPFSLHRIAAPWKSVV